MSGFVMRKNHRFKKLVPVRYLGDGVAGEGLIEDLSLTGSSMTGNVAVCTGMALALQIFVPGDPDPILMQGAIVKWVKAQEFGVEFNPLQPKVTEQITLVISALAKAEYCSSHNI